MTTAIISPEQRIVLNNVSWATYEALLSDHLDKSVPRFTYDRGVLEIMSPSPEHEKTNRTISLFVEVLAEEMDIDVENLGSTTFKREDLLRGFEPDSCFYIQSAELVRGKSEIDLTTDPPPDLVIEIDITSPSLDKFPLYAQVGVPEIWRYTGERIIIFTLEGGDYVERDESKALSLVAIADLSRFIEQSKTMRRTVWLRSVREWAKGRGQF
jgi:Uma2 family endonuclease